MAQRLYALALGYEDLNDHDELRHDPLLAVLVGGGGNHRGVIRAQHRRRVTHGHLKPPVHLTA